MHIRDNLSVLGTLTMLAFAIFSGSCAIDGKVLSLLAIHCNKCKTGCTTVILEIVLCAVLVQFVLLSSVFSHYVIAYNSAPLTASVADSSKVCRFQKVLCRLQRAVRLIY